MILGEAGDEPLLGVITLENLGLVLDPFKRTLQADETASWLASRTIFGPSNNRSQKTLPPPPQVSLAAVIASNTAVKLSGPMIVPTSAKVGIARFLFPQNLA